jgi:RNA polymerase sigma factor (sigma-70 family)
MPQRLASAVASRVRREVADSHLVSSFARTGDPEAFAELVRRHGPMVLGVCRKITRHAHDAEDAAQAAFLVFARRAGTIDPAGVASWLFGVAVNTAREARRRTSRRRETLSAIVPESGRFDPEPDFDTRAAIAEELAKLPHHYRDLVVRCDLEGESQAAVARRSGVPVGTVYSRLAAARTLLAGRLTRRGVAAGVAALAVPRTGAAFVPSDRPSSRVTELTEAVMRTGIGVKGKWLAVVVLTAGVAFGADGKAEKAAAPAPRPKDESRLVVGTGADVRFVSPDGRELLRVTGTDAKAAGADAATRSLSLGLSGKTGLALDVTERFATHGRLTPDSRMPLETRNGLYLLTPGGAAGPLAPKVGRVPHIAVWSACGTKAVAEKKTGVGGYFGKVGHEHVLIDVTAGTATPLKLPAGHRVVGWSPDGAWFLTILNEQEWSLPDGWQTKNYALCRVAADGRVVKPLLSSRVERSADARSAEWVSAAALSPDGTTAAVVLYQWKQVGPPMGYEHGFEVVAVDVASGTRKSLVSEPGGKRADGKTYAILPGEVRWSPDGTRIAFGYDESVCEKVGEWATFWRLVTTASDGTDRRGVLAIDRHAKGEERRHYSLIDWR